MGLLKQRPTSRLTSLLCTQLSVFDQRWLTRRVHCCTFFAFLSSLHPVFLCLLIRPLPLAAPHQSGFIAVLLLLVIKSHFPLVLHLHRLPCFSFPPLFLHLLSFLACAQEASSVYTYERKRSQIRHKRPLKYSLHLSTCVFFFSFFLQHSIEYSSLKHIYLQRAQRAEERNLLAFDIFPIFFPE